MGTFVLMGGFLLAGLYKPFLSVVLRMIKPQSRFIYKGLATANSSNPKKDGLYMNYQNPDGVTVHDGFPNPATDTSLQPLDLNSLLITHTATTYLMRLSGDEWQALGIFDGDILIVDRSVNARPNDLVVWTKADRFIISHEHQVEEGSPVWGVITSTIHQFRKVSR